MTIDKALIFKYNNPVPRYTSYPPANYFSAELVPDNPIDLYAESNSWEPQNISYYIHIPFCNKLCFYCGCNSCPKTKTKDVEEYIKALKTEIILVKSRLDKNRKISQIHFGGGTPNSIDSNYLEEIIQVLSEGFEFIIQPEIAIECHPAYLDENYIESLHRAGFNRFSLGIQDFNPVVLRNINREVSKIPLSELMSLLQGNLKKAVNLDFIYGLPGQTAESFLKTIEKAVELKPDRLVTFSYAHVPWVNKNQLILERIGLPESEEKMDMFLAATDFLTKNGYSLIGMDHFVQDNDELFKAVKAGNLHRNFQGYCTRRTTGQVYAFGSSAISQLEMAYIQNYKTPETYIESIQKGRLAIERAYLLNRNETIIREAITSLMCNRILDFNKLAEQYGLNSEMLKQLMNFDERAIEDFEKDEILTYSDNKIVVSEAGSLFIRNVAAKFDPMMVQQNLTYSKSL